MENTNSRNDKEGKWGIKMGIVELKGFSKYYGEFLAVDTLDLVIEKGEIVGFVGKNGAGKSTTIRCMMNMLFPSRGRITIDGLDSVKDAKEIRKITSYMPSEADFSETINSFELFKFCTKFTKNGIEKAMELAKEFELDPYKKIGSLSLGNKKKVAIVHSLIKESKIILLDEPTTGLDPLMQEKFFEHIQKERAKGTTVFLSSHNLSEIEKYCDKVAIIKGGKLVDYLDMANVKIERKKIVSYRTKSGETESYLYNGKINELISELSVLNLESLEIKNSSVEDEFIKYYKEDADE